MALPALEMVALLETPTGFAFFSVYKDLCKGPKNLWSWFIRKNIADAVISLLEFVKIHNKSFVRRKSGPGLVLSRSIEMYCGKSGQLIVEDVELRNVIKSNLHVKCFENEAIISELMWGLKHLLSDYVREERDNITLEYRLPLSQGLEGCMRKYEVVLRPEAIDRTFITCAGTLYRCDVMIDHYRKRLHEICDPLVPAICEMVDDDIPYVEVAYAELVAKILAPAFVQDWNPFEYLTDDVVKKIKDSAAANNAREKVNGAMRRLIYNLAYKLRMLPVYRTSIIETLKSLADSSGGRKRNQSEIVEPTSSQDGYRAGGANANGVCVKKARAESEGGAEAMS